MRLPYAWMEVNGGPAVRCYPGAILGRMAAARIVLQSPFVSEAHALLSARDDGLYLLALRRPILAGGEPVRQVRLSEGLEVTLAPGSSVRVSGLWFPDERLALMLDAGPPQGLDWRIWRIHVDRTPWLGPAEGHRPGDGTVWCTEGELWTDLGGGPELVVPGCTWTVRGHQVSAVSIPRYEVGWTESAPERRARAAVVATVERAQVIDEVGHEAIFTGLEATLLYLLAREGGSTSKARAAVGLWGANAGEAAQSNLERNVLHRVRRALRAQGVRDDIIVNREGWLAFGDGVSSSCPTSAARNISRGAGTRSA